MRTGCIVILVGLLLILTIEGCFNNAQQSTYANGERLARKYCSSCHLFVPPNMLDSITWIDHILPKMAPKLGIGVRRGRYYYKDTSVKVSFKISYKKWMALVAYYKKLARLKLKPAKAPVPLEKDWSIFKLQIPHLNDTSSIATTTLVRIDPLHGVIYSGDAKPKQLYKWNEKLKITKQIELPSPPVNLYLDKKSRKIVTCIGILKASKLTKGNLVFKMKNGIPMPFQTLNLNNGQVLSMYSKNGKDSFKVVAKKLHRPVETVAGDFNRDGSTDWVVCAFGHDQGGLFLYQKDSKQKYNKIAISRMPGAEEAFVKDFNHDGWPDIMALFAQAREGIWLFLNNHEGGFVSKNILKFQPEYGSTSFQIVDFNQDGKQDILYTCGDNGDYSKILKPYHGVYIFLNKGNLKYKQTYFYPINGCTKAVATDFDKDGDLDIAAIAFFADFKTNPSESFVYLEQDNPMHFIPHGIPIHKYGRWLCMDIGDYDGDEDLDIVLGNYAKSFLKIQKVKSKWNNYIPLVVLSNNFIK